MPVIEMTGNKGEVLRKIDMYIISCKQATGYVSRRVTFGVIDEIALRLSRLRPY